jgi:hypothetical protein
LHPEHSILTKLALFFLQGMGTQNDNVTYFYLIL